MVVDRGGIREGGSGLGIWICKYYFGVFVGSFG